jgi:hypothetical protein
MGQFDESLFEGTLYNQEETESANQRTIAISTENVSF